MFVVYIIVFTGSLVGICCGAVITHRQPPYQNLLVYENYPTRLTRLTNCTNIADIANISYQELQDTSDLTCYDDSNRTVTLNITKSNFDQLEQNSTNAQYYILRTEELEKRYGASSEKGVMLETSHPITCWNGSKWKTQPGWMNGNSTKICCSPSLEPGNSCSDVLYINGSNILQEETQEIRTGYGFTINYTVNAWPHSLLKSKLRCGGYQCNFTGEKSDSGDCSINYTSHYMSTSFLNQSFSKPAIYLHPYHVQITVPRLTQEFNDTSCSPDDDTCGNLRNCSFSFGLDGVQEKVARSDFKLLLQNSPAIVTHSSDVGLLDLAQFEDKNPLCLGDGWNRTTAVDHPEWSVRSDEKLDGKFKKKGRDFNGRKNSDTYLFKVGGVEFDCTFPGGSPSRRMMFVKADDPFSKHSSVMNQNFTCKVDKTKWDPRPTRIGWTHPNGHETEVELNDKENAQNWSVPTNESGTYRCWAEVSRSWAHNSVRREKLITDNRVPSPSTSVELATTLTHSNKPPNTNDRSAEITPSPATGGDGMERETWYWIGLGVVAALLVITTLSIYKVVKKYQVKVINLDTKMSLDKVKSKMGINALYSRVAAVPEDDQESLLSRIPHIHKEHLVTDVVLGTGQFGKVLKGTLSVENEDGSSAELAVAVKCLVHAEQDESITDEFLKEVLTMVQLDHQNVVKLLGICTEYDQYMIVAEFMERGSLKDFLMSRNPVLSLTDKLYICHQIASGLEHIASQNIVHRDIAARNCLVGPNLLVKVADFGLSRSLTMSNYYKKVGGQVPIRWMSPEAVKYGRYTPESDVWAFGVVMWEVYTEGHFPYSGYSNEEVQNMLDNGFKLHVPPHCTEDMSVLMQATWETEPASRPTFKIIKSRLHQMLRNSDYWDTLRSSTPTTSSEPQPSTSADYPADTTYPLDTTLCRDGLLCARDESRSSTPDLASNRYATEPGLTVETAL